MDGKFDLFVKIRRQLNSSNMYASIFRIEEVVTEANFITENNVTLDRI